MWHCQIDGVFPRPSMGGASTDVAREDAGATMSLRMRIRGSRVRVLSEDGLCNREYP